MCNVVIDYDTGQVIDRKDPPKEWVVEYLAVEFAKIVKARHSPHPSKSKILPPSPQGEGYEKGAGV